MSSLQSPAIPDWVNQQLFQGLIKEHYSNLLAIEKFTSKAAISMGENYLTIVLRIQIEMQMKDETKKDVNYILKIPLVNDRGDDHEFHDLFVSELDMYDRLVPELESIYAKNTSLLVKFKPLHYKFTDKEMLPKCDYLLMEDLRAGGYKNVDRTVGLNQREMEAVLKKLAQWHSASAVRVSQLGDYEEAYKVSYFSEEHIKFIDGMNISFCVPFLECMQQAYGLDPGEQILISNYMSRLTDLYMDFGRINPAELNVLNHGDFWCNNFMFKLHEESNEILDVCFVDYQLPKYGTPAQDLFCLLMTSPQLGIKLSNFDYFVEFYHQELTKHLVLLHYNRNVPTLQQLQQNLFENSLWAFLCAQRMLPIVLLPADVDSHIGNFMGETEEAVAFKRKTFLSPAYVEQIKLILPWLIARSYIR
ncbi:uncharacterized protein LOC6650744 [Drosophila willistoni]|uniref:uncharacterized protein LOC6650744 n=1 Tax=Drosophila willistoni TaxID=7260 RepID=UPI00017D96E9|nr:uncharacterized protein LOC6650744 [Drosophila willistoni]